MKAAIRLVRPMQAEYITVGHVLRWYANDFYDISEEQFVKDCMVKSNGSMNPNRVKAIYHQLREEAGLNEHSEVYSLPNKPIY